MLRLKINPECLNLHVMKLLASRGESSMLQSSSNASPFISPAILFVSELSKISTRDLDCIKFIKGRFLLTHTQGQKQALQTQRVINRFAHIHIYYHLNVFYSPFIRVECTFCVVYEALGHHW